MIRLLKISFICAFVIIGVFTGKPHINLPMGYCRPDFSLDLLLGCSPLGQKMISLVVWGAGGTLLAATLGLLLSFAFALAGLGFAVIFGKPGFFLTENTSRALLSVPSIFLAVTLGVIFGSSIWALVLAIAISEWAYAQQWLMGRYTDKNLSQFVVASRAMGASDFFIFQKHLLPQFFIDLRALFLVNLPVAVLAVASLEFLGVSSGDQFPSLGYQISAWKDYMFLFPHIALSPIFMLVSLLLTLSALRSRSHQSSD